MTDEKLSRIEQAFHAAISARAAGARLDLGALCGGDDALAAEVQNLLQHLDDADGNGAGNDVAASTSFLSPEELHNERSEAVAGAAAAAVRFPRWIPT
jgi:hypothetical protein